MADNPMKTLIREVPLYAAISAFLLCVDVALFWILVQYFSWPYLVAATASFSVGILVSYILSVIAVFNFRKLRSRPIEFASFAAIGIVGLAINAAAMSSGAGYLREHYLTAKCSAACLTYVWNFMARRQLLFVKGRADA